MEFNANCGVWNTMFGVPCIVADNLLKLASGDQIKALLYILRNPGRPVSHEEIAAAAGITSEKAEEAILFWQQVNVLTGDMRSSSGIMSAPTAAESPAPSPVLSPAPAAKEIAAPPKRTDYTPSNIAAMMAENSDLSDMFKITEQILGKLNHSMQTSLIWMYNYLGLKKEVIITLVNYHYMTGKASASAMEKTAARWAESGINDLNAAQEEVERMNNSNTFTGEIKKMFEMNHAPTSKQQDFIDNWQRAGFSVQLIHLAYERTLEQINKLSFEYINKILLKWKELNLRTPEDVQASEDNYRKNKKSESKAASDGFDPEKYKIFINNI